MQYTPESLLNFHEMANDLNLRSHSIINIISQKNPEVFDGKEVEFDDIVVEQDYVYVWYIDKYELEQFLKIPYEQWCKGTLSSANYIVDEWNATHKPAYTPKVIENPADIWEYISTLKPHSNRWRYAIDISADYVNKGKDPSMYLNEIIEIIDNKLLEY